MHSTFRPGSYKRCVALVLALMLCLAPLAALGNGVHGTVTSTRALNLRDGPGTNARILTSFPRGTWVQVLETTGNWHKVQVDNWVGYMSANFISLGNTNTATDAKVSGATGFINLRASASLTATVLATYPNGTAVKILARVGGFYQVQVGQQTGFMVDYLVRVDNVRVEAHGVIRTANGGNVNIRTAPSMSAPVIQSFPPGQRVEILQRGSGWHKVRCAGVTGYMHAGFLSIGGSGGSGGSATTVTASLKNPNGGSIVNFRKNPGLDTRILAEHRVGKTVTVLGYYNADWAQVSIDGVIGYVSSYFLKF